ncbi:outer membrane protein assembly factor BamD [Halopseudomonas xinjiangensis]|uniref:Outer membrane protein assembly factor BamD n=2 Tax=Halopseudomonas xinjiangensis TaxID=487184 RepID=A0A1H1UAQ9_9GAMM|nr:outer membrane protein assembly factor BamD [Halopseudomonas xinjiangensis]
MMLAGLGGCAGLGQNDAERTGEVADVRAKLGLGRCDADLARQTLALKQPELEQEAAFVCLQQAEFGLVDRLLADYEERYASPPNPDYSAYLLALTEFLRFEAALGDAQQRLLTGRIAHAALVGFVRDYPTSEYRGEVAPRLQQILEGMATAEFDLAKLAAETGDPAAAEARMRYVTRQYARTAAAKEARAWLELIPD